MWSKVEYFLNGSHRFICVKLLTEINNKKACINIKNGENYCIIYVIRCAIVKLNRDAESEFLISSTYSSEIILLYKSKFKWSWSSNFSLNIQSEKYGVNFWNFENFCIFTRILSSWVIYPKIFSFNFNSLSLFSILFVWKKYLQKRV